VLPVREPFRILFVNAVDPYSWYESRQPPLGLGYLVSSVRAFVPDVEFEFRVVSRNVVDEAASFAPQLVGLTTVSQNLGIACDYTRHLARRGIPVILGGPHVSALPGGLPEEAVAACLGESERTFAELVRLAVAGDLTPTALTEVQGIAYRDSGAVRLTEPRPPIKEIDTLPMADRRYLPIGRRAYVFSSRGCPYRCSFCAPTRFWKTTRFHSAAYVVDEIEVLTRQFGARLISFYDDLFVVRPSRVEEILRTLERRGLLGKVGFSCNCRANLVTDELATLLVRMGFQYVTLGLESGDEETLRYLKGDNVTVEQNRRAVEILRRHGLKVNAFFVIGSPHETRERMMRTRRFIRETKPDLLDVLLLIPYPGTPVWEEALRRGLVSEVDFDWSRLNMNVYLAPEKAVILSEVMNRQDLLAEYHRFHRMQNLNNALRILRHPLRTDLLGTAFLIARECFHKRRKR
jgi:radical SAM superfamily enzyme YgiQ (UPF0313 family)